MSLRIGVDLDGTLADLSSLYHEYEETLFGARSEATSPEIEEAEEALTDRDKVKAEREASKRRDAVWRALRNTPDMWMQLKPIEPNAVRELQDAALTCDWEVYFITQRPKTAGSSVQRQTQMWLRQQGFDAPSVLTLSGARGKAALTLDLDFLLDDLPKNCVDVIADSRCRPILIMRTPDPAAEAAARRMHIGVVRSVSEAIALLKVPIATPRTSTVTKILQRLGLSR